MMKRLSLMQHLTRLTKPILACLLLFNAGVLVGLLIATTPSQSGGISRSLIGSLSSSSDTEGPSVKLSRPAKFHPVETLQQCTAARSPVQTEVACDRLFANDAAEQQRAQRLMDASRAPADYQSDERLAERNCTEIRRAYVTRTLSQEEADFPIAFSLVVFKDFYQVEQLFRAVYRPEHFYCFHVDVKSKASFHRAVLKHASCFPNAVVSEKRSDVRWASFAVLEADLHCMERLLAMSKSWRYFLNLVGQEYPLRTMRELVRILKSLNGANNLENAGQHNGVKPLSVRLPNGTRYRMKWYKGSVHATLTRGFVEFVFSDVGRQIVEHLRKNGAWPCPDETFFASLNFNARELQVPGGDLTGLQTDRMVRQPFFNRYKNWLFGVFGYPCLSVRSVRQICIWGVKDLPEMNKRPEFFVNKFYYNFQRFALQCMVERFWNNTLADYTPGGHKTHEVSLQFYTQFDFVRKHV